VSLVVEREGEGCSGRVVDAIGPRVLWFQRPSPSKLASNRYLPLSQSIVVDPTIRVARGRKSREENRGDESMRCPFIEGTSEPECEPAREPTPTLFPARVSNEECWRNAAKRQWFRIYRESFFFEVLLFNSSHETSKR